MMFAQYDISGDTPSECRPESEEVLEEEIKMMAFDERFYFPHNYEEGDQVSFLSTLSVLLPSQISFIFGRYFRLLVIFLRG